MTSQLSIGDPVTRLCKIENERIPFPKGLSDLPPELLEGIVSWLDQEPDFLQPSGSHQRFASSLDTNHCSLKSLALTCYSMHDLVAPRLFRFMRFKVDDSNDIEGRGVRKEVIKRFEALITKYELRQKVHSVTVRFEEEKPVRRIGQPLIFGSILCGQILSAFYPESPTVLAPSSVIPYLTYKEFWAPAEDMWEFVGPSHVLHSAQMAKKQAENVSRYMQNISGSCNNQERSWQSRMSNVGHCGQASMDERGRSFDAAFDSFGKQIHPDWAPNLRNVTYVAIFPKLDHMYLVYDKLGQLPNLQSLTLQFTPTGNLDMLEKIARTRECPISSVWLDVDACLEMALSFVRNHDLGYRHRNLHTLTFLDWYRHGTAMMVAHSCKDYLPNFAFENGSLKKFKER